MRYNLIVRQDAASLDDGGDEQVVHFDLSEADFAAKRVTYELLGLASDYHISSVAVTAHQLEHRVTAVWTPVSWSPPRTVLYTYDSLQEMKDKERDAYQLDEYTIRSYVPVALRISTLITVSSESYVCTPI